MNIFSKRQVKETLNRREFLTITCWSSVGATALVFAARRLPQPANLDCAPKGPPTPGSALVNVPADREALYVSLYAAKGEGYRKNQVRAYSHYNAEIVVNGQPRGRSRIWGDALHKTQRYAIDALMMASRTKGLADNDAALVLAIARVESGFSPDAAAGTSSASGLGQFLNSTGLRYGLTAENRWDVQAQANALVAHTFDNIEIVQRARLSRQFVYALHHDGALDNRNGGLDLSLGKVMPLMAKMEAFVTVW